MNDSYGSSLRDRMKRIMSEPAGFKPMNRVEPRRGALPMIVVVFLLAFAVYEIIIRSVR